MLGSNQLDASQIIKGDFDLRKLSEGSTLSSASGGPQSAFTSQTSGGDSTQRIDTALSAASQISGQRIVFDSSLAVRTSVETRGQNTAFVPLINL